LFINNDKSQVFEHGLIFDEHVRPDEKIHFAGGGLLQQFLSLRLLDASANDSDAIVQRAKYTLRINEVLLGKYFGRRHQGSLVTVFDGDDDRFKGNNGFPASYVSLHQPDHRIRGLQIIHNFLQHSLLRGRRMKRENLLETLARTVWRFESN